MYELQTLLKKYLKKHPGKENELAKMFSISRATLKKWQNGHLPHPAMAKVVIARIKKELLKDG